MSQKKQQLQCQQNSLEIVENKQSSLHFNDFPQETKQLYSMYANDENFMNFPEHPDIMQSVRNIRDIPKKYIKRVNHPMPYQAFILDSASFRLFRKAIGYTRTTKESDKQNYVDKINSYFPNDPRTDKALVTLCVRSTWDLYFQARKFPKGSEIIMTGITIPDMIRITEEHGLVPVPLDLAIDTLMPSLDDIKRAIGPKTKAIIFAYIFGVTYDISPYVPLLNSANVEIIEDAAQSFRGLEAFKGSPHALMTMFSFGTIKHNSAFFGSVSNMRPQNEKHKGDQPLYEQMESIQFRYQQYTAKEYRAKIQKIMVVYAFLQPPKMVEFSTRMFKLLGIDSEEFQTSTVRGFAAVDDSKYLEKFRLKTCAANVRMIIERTLNYKEKDHQEKLYNYKKVSEALTKNGIFVPGQAHGTKRSYWLFPMVVSNKNQFRDFMQAQGVFCYKTATQICPVPMPEHKKAELGELTQVNNFYDNQVFLPIHNQIEPEQLNLMIERIVGISLRYDDYLNQCKPTTEFKKWPKSKLPLAKM